MFGKGKLQKEGIFFLIHLFARDILLMTKLEIKETYLDLIKVGLVFSIFNFFKAKIHRKESVCGKKYPLCAICL